MPQFATVENPPPKKQLLVGKRKQLQNVNKIFWGGNQPEISKPAANDRFAKLRNIAEKQKAGQLLNQAEEQKRNLKLRKDSTGLPQQATQLIHPKSKDGRLKL